ncbi:hypothetical protein DIPPA_12216 [Diplonema papillatum]|nr:hypothetical protein DIPPA_12216 [Diplonema papillatum]
MSTTRTLAPPPGPPDVLNEPLTIVLVVVACFLFLMLCALVIYVYKLQTDFKKEQHASEEAKDTKLRELHETKDAKEKEVLHEMAERLRQLRQNYELAMVNHARFIKDHDPELFEQMKESGEIHVAGEEIVEVHEERDIDAELAEIHKESGIDVNFTEEEKQELLANTEKTSRAKHLRAQMKELKRKQEARRKERTLEDERLALEQRLLDIESEEKLDALKRLEKKQKERDEVDNMLASKRLAITPNGEYIITRMGGAKMEFDTEPYDSDLDFDDRLPEMPEHLDDINPRGKELKGKLEELTHELRKDKAANRHREVEMERDMTLMRLRLAQAQRSNAKAERAMRENADEKAKDRASFDHDSFLDDHFGHFQPSPGGSPPPPRGNRDSFNPSYHVPPALVTKEVNPFVKDVPKHKHTAVPHFITAPWEVSGLAKSKTARADSHSPPRTRRKAQKHLMDYIASAMRDPDAQREALDSGEYLDVPVEEQAEAMKVVGEDGDQRSRKEIL